MKYGLFMMPMHLPEKPPAQAFEEDIDLLIRADALGYTEAWIGEHFTSAWENIPAPDLLIARLIPHIQQMILGTGVVLLQYHHPVLVANRLAYLDHLTGGRLYVGFGSGGLPSDSKLFGVPMDGRARFMTRESVEIILKLWTEEPPFEYHGDYWHITAVPPDPISGLGIYVKPLQSPHPPIAVAGTNLDSATLQIAGEHGWIPMSSSQMPIEGLLSHWRSVEAGAQLTGRLPDRRQWRVARQIHVAETTKAARHDVLTGVMARAHRDYLYEGMKRGGRLAALKTDPTMPDEAVTPEFLLDRNWTAGDPDECARQLREVYEKVGGFGYVLMLVYDWEPRQKMLTSMELFAKEVMPKLTDLS
ncbi:MAG: LLM class flavin-dependent oxidoreductase [Nitrospinae bacterium]|nr:LLM class flavin-dependent oxidoreductase [Nitrospinota bacterium]